MSSTLELTEDHNGSLAASNVVNSEITKIVGNLYFYSAMLPPERKIEKDLIDEIRNDLFRLRFYLDKHFAFKPE